MIVLSLIFFFLGLFLYCSFTIILGLKYIYYPDRWSSLLRNPTAIMYAGCIPMGAATLINIAVVVINGQLNYGGKPFLYFLWAMWWLDVFISFLCCWVGVHTMYVFWSCIVPCVLKCQLHLLTRITLQKQSLDAMTARWLLPVMTLMVASTSGGVVGRAIQVHSKLYSLQTLLVSVFMVAVGFTLTLMILTIYLMRLFLHGLPPNGKVLSVFLPIGPTSQSGYSILLIGQNFHKLLPFPSLSSDFFNYPATGIVVEVVCTCASFLLWSLATMWILYALLALYSGVRQAKIVFKASFWGIVFPNVCSLWSSIVRLPLKLLTSFRLSTHTIQSN